MCDVIYMFVEISGIFNIIQLQYYCCCAATDLSLGSAG